jgi:NTE family protein
MARDSHTLLKSTTPTIGSTRPDQRFKATMSPETTLARGGNHKRRPGRPPFDSIILLLQGGGALGAYQAGVYEALAEADLHPDWTAGISIGAINAAIIAGNPPERRVDQLRTFWRFITQSPATGLGFFDGGSLTHSVGTAARQLANQLSASSAAFSGVAGFFAPRLPSPWLWPAGTVQSTSYYDTRQLEPALERVIDFDRINAGVMRLSLGAVNVATGNFVHFDTTTHTIRTVHVMASGALPPGFPAIEIDGQHYWDGGLVSNTPLEWVVQNRPQGDTLAFQIDLWNARGDLPTSMGEVTTRQKEIQYSSRTRAYSDRFKHMQTIRSTLASLLEKLPEEMKDLPEVQMLKGEAEHGVHNLIQLIYRARKYEGDSKDYEFSRQSMEEHWRAGYHDTVRTLRHPKVLERPRDRSGLFIFDIDGDGRE